MRRRSSIRGLRRPPAFSLLEIVVVLAIFGLVAGLLIGGAASLLRNSDEDSTEYKALSAVGRARHQAVLSGRTLDLTYDRESRRLDWEAGSDTLIGRDELQLLPPERLSSMLLGGRLVEEPIARVRFYPDGTCDPFRLEIAQERTSRILLIDSWTCSVLKPGAAAPDSR